MKYSSGNALFLILIAIALFGALSYAVTNVSTGAKNTSGENTSLKTNDLLEYAGALKAGVNLVYTHNNVSESDIRFAHPDLDAGYGTYASLEAKQLVFDKEGGGVVLKPVDTSILDSTYSGVAGYGKYLFTGTLAVKDVGSNLPELLVVVPFLSQQACAEINRKIGVNDIPQDFSVYIAANYTTVQFAGGFPGGNGLGDDGYANAGLIAGKTSLCIQSVGAFPVANTYHFYSVLLER